MWKFVVAMILVAALLAGGLMKLLRNRQPMGSPEALERARLRNREIEEQERREADGG